MFWAVLSSEAELIKLSGWDEKTFAPNQQKPIFSSFVSGHCNLVAMQNF